MTKAEEAVPWDQLMPVRMVTDYKSVSNTIRKESQSVGDRSSATNVAILRQLRITGCNPPAAKATLIWVPIKHLVADSLPKNGRHKIWLGFSMLQKVQIDQAQSARSLLFVGTASPSVFGVHVATQA